MLGTRLEGESQRIMDALQEGKVMAVVELYHKGLLAKNSTRTLRQDLHAYLASVPNGLGLAEEDANYWLDWLKITD